MTEFWILLQNLKLSMIPLDITNSIQQQTIESDSGLHKKKDEFAFYNKHLGLLECGNGVFGAAPGAGALLSPPPSSLLLPSTNNKGHLYCKRRRGRKRRRRKGVRGSSRLVCQLRDIIKDPGSIY